jgi:PKD repeat protein
MNLFLKIAKLKIENLLVLLIALVWLLLPTAAFAQEETSPSPTPPPLVADAGPNRATIVGKELTFDLNHSTLPPEAPTPDIIWDFGDGVRTTGPQVSHAFSKAGTYQVRLRFSTPEGLVEDTTEVRVFSRLLVLAASSALPPEDLTRYQEQAASEDTLLLIIEISSGPESTIAEELSRELTKISADLARAEAIITVSGGSVGANALSQFAQTRPPSLSQIGILILSETPLGVISPSAQTVFDQLQPLYVIVSRPEALSYIVRSTNAEEIKTNLIDSTINYRLLGTFSARTVRDIGLTNFMSFGINYLINRGVPVSNIILILMLPLIATILSFTRQVVGIKAFGLVTPAMTTLSFLVLGLVYGLIAFAAILASGTLTRLALRRLRLLYLPRMALVLTSSSLAILILLGLSAAFKPAALASFSIFPVLLLIVLAEEFISVQFSAGAKAAAKVTIATLLLAIAGYYVMSWELLRTFLVSYPETVLLTIPINIIFGRWSGLRLTEYLRFRQLLKNHH